MVARATPFWAWLLPFVFGAPWIVASIWYWRHRPRDGEIPPSAAEMVRKRLWQ
jgi:hypothetical protein